MEDGVDVNILSGTRRWSAQPVFRSWEPENATVTPAPKSLLRVHSRTPYAPLSTRFAYLGLILTTMPLIEDFDIWIEVDGIRVDEYEERVSQVNSQEKKKTVITCFIPSTAGKVRDLCLAKHLDND